MTVRVGVIGVGMIGQDHIRRLTQVIAGAQVVAVTDVDSARAEAVARDLPAARVHASGHEVTDDDHVDAVVVTSWGATHEEYVLGAIAAGKPVFCEKPLATASSACSRIMDAEVAGGQRLVQVGFMRRYDATYRALKAVTHDGSIGAPLLVHCAHRNPSVPDFYTADMSINDTAIHEIDLARWLLEEEITAVSVRTPRRNSRAAEGFNDPMMIYLETESDVLVDVEVSVNAAYGYDIRGEVVGETGTVSLAAGSGVVVRRDGAYVGRVPADWRERFVRAYDVELQEWVNSVAAGGCTGPSSWDGYAATAVAEACTQALRSGERTPVSLREQPDFYAKTH